MINKSLGQINKNFWLLTSLFFCLAVASATKAAEPQTQQEAYAVVSNYLAAWHKGDYNTMYALWDARSRQAVTPDQLSHVLTVDITGDTQDGVKIRQLLGGASQLLRGRIASVVSVKVHPETSDYATADCEVQTTFQSLNGVAFVRLLPDALKQAKATDAQTKRGDGTLAVALFALGADKPEVVSTFNKDFRAYTYGQDLKNERGPYTTLYVHKYTLVKEQGQWRISNAVTVSNEPPVEATSEGVGKPTK